MLKKTEDLLVKAKMWVCDGKNFPHQGHSLTLVPAFTLFLGFYPNGSPLYLSTKAEKKLWGSFQVDIYIAYIVIADYMHAWWWSSWSAYIPHAWKGRGCVEVLRVTSMGLHDSVCVWEISSWRKHIFPICTKCRFTTRVQFKLAIKVHLRSTSKISHQYQSTYSDTHSSLNPL